MKHRVGPAIRLLRQLISRLTHIYIFRFCSLKNEYGALNINTLSLNSSMPIYPSTCPLVNLNKSIMPYSRSRASAWASRYTPSFYKILLITQLPSPLSSKLFFFLLLLHTGAPGREKTRSSHQHCNSSEPHSLKLVTIRS